LAAMGEGRVRAIAPLISRGPVRPLRSFARIVDGTHALVVGKRAGEIAFGRAAKCRRRCCVVRWQGFCLAALTDYA